MNKFIDNQDFTRAVAGAMAYFLFSGGATLASRENTGLNQDLIEDGRKPLPMADFTIKDSGQRQSFESGMVRDVTEGKIDYTLALDGPMFKRLADHLTKGAKKYAKRNWMLANGPAEADRFQESALRHFLQWLNGDVDEDHAAAVFFNINGAEYVKDRMRRENKDINRFRAGSANPIPYDTQSFDMKEEQ